tara:strand:- start:304 stop:504 length:201 start_codon:yes stop_codon:yes gene_type:complete
MTEKEKALYEYFIGTYSWEDILESMSDEELYDVRDSLIWQGLLTYGERGGIRLATPDEIARKKLGK